MDGPTGFQSDNLINIELINNDGAGFSGQCQVIAGTTVGQLFAQKCPSGDPSHYHIRVNREPCSAEKTLSPNDRVSFTPSKVTGY
jgi:hypothetical protein